MFKSKHSGWTWDLKRTPFGGDNPLSGITDSISSALGTDGSGGGVLGALADIDPGPAIGKGLSEVDTFVNREIPGGWTLPAAIAAAYATGYIDPSLFAAGETSAAGLSGGGAFVPAAGSGASFTILPEATYTIAGATTAGEAAYNSALASGLSQAEATAAANQAATNYTYNLAGQGISSQSGQQAFFDALANGATSQEALNQGIAAQYAGQGLTAGEDLFNIVQNYPNMSAEQLQSIMEINYGTDPMLSYDAANLAASGYSPEAINQVLSYSYTPAELSGTGINSLQSALPSQTIQSQLNNAKKAYDVAKLLRQGATSGLSSSIGQLAQGANPYGQDLTAAVRGNQNPFVQSQYFQVSDNKPNLTKLAELLKQA